MEMKNKQVLWALENRLCNRRAYETLLSAHDLTKALQHHIQGARDPDKDPLEDVLVKHKATMEHILLLDGALDRWTSEFLLGKEKKGL